MSGYAHDVSHVVPVNGVGYVRLSVLEATPIGSKWRIRVQFNFGKHLIFILYKLRQYLFIYLFIYL